MRTTTGLRLTLCGLVAVQTPLRPAQSGGIPSSDQPAIFALAVTDITDTGARVVFTSTVPMRGTVNVAAGAGPARTLQEDAAREIHAFTLDGLVRGGDYTLDVRAATDDGAATATHMVSFRAGARTPRFDRFDGRTAFGAQHGTEIPLLQEVGAQVVRITIPWDNIQRMPGVWEESALARLVEQCRALRASGIEPLAVLAFFRVYMFPAL
jgi:hypothetical protein